MEYGEYEYEEHPEGLDPNEEYSAWGEIAVNSIYDGEHLEHINCVKFDASEESLWIASGGGTLVQQICPSLERYSMITAHDQGILALRSMGQSIVSLSPGQLCLHGSGCAPYIAFNDDVGDLAALEIDHHGALLGRSSGGISSFDLSTGRLRSTIDTAGKGVVALSGPLERGGFVMGSVDGHISFLDPRNNYKQTSSLIAHSGGFAALVASRDIVATAGYVGRLGRVSLESVVKIFDVRMGLRMMGSIPFAPGPTMLSFHPLYTTSLLVGSASGMFTMAETSIFTTGSIECVDTGGSALLCCDISLSGECIAFGDAGGYIHLWAGSDNPKANVGGSDDVLQLPPPPDPSPYMLDEDASFWNIPMYFPPDGSAMASDIGPKETMKVGLGPRIIDPSILATGKQSDFVLYIPNPKHSNASGREAKGKSSAAISELRNRRVQSRPDEVDAETVRAERAVRRADAGGIVLPGRYRRVAIKQKATAKFEEFDFRYYNKTPFPGFENNLANSYTNAIVQVLFFIRAVRDIAFLHAPEVSAEFSIIGELSLLFRMMSTADADVCQTSNLLRALRQSKEAAGLGLLEGVRGERTSTDIEVEAQKDKSLARRAQRLSRFLLEQLNKEFGALSSMQFMKKDGRGIGGSDGGVGANNSSSSLSNVVGTSSTSFMTTTATTTTSATPIEDIFGLTLRQRTRCLSKSRPDQERIAKTFQVELQYPSPKERPPLRWKSSYTSSMTSPDSIPSLGTAPASANTNANANTKSETAPDASGDIKVHRPSFSDLLASSLHTISDMRAWFDEVVSYQMVRQERVPSRLPQVMVVNCGLEDLGDIAWWQPVEVEEEKETRNDNDKNKNDKNENTANDEDAKSLISAGEKTRETMSTLASATYIDDTSTDKNSIKKYRPWLPLAVAITTDSTSWNVRVDQSNSKEELMTLVKSLDPVPEGAQREIYELTAVIAHIRDEDEADIGGKDYEGHLLAHIKVSPSHYHHHYNKTDATTSSSSSMSASIMPLPVFDWLVFNDFHITPSTPGEVTELYGGQKIPVLLYFTRVECGENVVDRPSMIQPTPVLSQESFIQLCRAPPLQPNKARLHRPPFIPLSPRELPSPGDLFALDAEFVQYSPPERVIRRGLEIEMRSSRLGLGRVSVVRGSGPHAGVPCIDDYIRSVEPVHDYLTQFSGLVPGDLDTSSSRHHLTTLRCAYLKLRYLVDAKVVFVGHGLKQDFKMLNIIVPKDQIIDTIDLFYSGRGRRLSLRFLSSYLLGTTIQGGTHDSIEDALAALKLYLKYKELNDDGRFDVVLAEMYQWGNVHGWDPVAWNAAPSHHLVVDKDRKTGGEKTGDEKLSRGTMHMATTAMLQSHSAAAMNRPLLPPGLVPAMQDASLPQMMSVAGPQQQFVQQQRAQEQQFAAAQRLAFALQQQQQQQQQRHQQHPPGPPGILPMNGNNSNSNNK